MAKSKRLVAFTSKGKVVIDWDKINIVLTKEEKVEMTRLLGKLIEHDKQLERED